MKVYTIIANGKEVGFTFHFSTAIQKKRELEREGIKVVIKEEDFK